MTYTLPESTKLIEKGVLNLDLEDITKLLDGFFKPSETPPQADLTRKFGKSSYQDAPKRIITEQYASSPQDNYS